MITEGEEKWTKQINHSSEWLKSDRDSGSANL